MVEDSGWYGESKRHSDVQKKDSRFKEQLEDLKKIINNHDAPSHSRIASAQIYIDNGDKSHEIFLQQEWEHKVYEIGKKHNLLFYQSRALGGLFKERFPEERDDYYVDTWASRLENGSAWAHADNDTRKVLRKYGVVGKLNPDGVTYTDTMFVVNS